MDNDNVVMTPPPAHTFRKSRLPISLVIMGVTALIFPLYITFQILPQLSKLVETMGGGPNGFLFFIPLILVLSFFIAQLFYGINLINLQKRQGGLNDIQRKIAFGFFVCGIVAGILAIPALAYSVVSTVYGLTDALK